MKYMLNVNTREFRGFTLPEPGYFRKEYGATLELLYGVRDKKARKIYDCGVRDLAGASAMKLSAKRRAGLCPPLITACLL
jgi:hypothetical protein